MYHYCNSSIKDADFLKIQSPLITKLFVYNDVLI